METIRLTHGKYDIIIQESSSNIEIQRIFGCFAFIVLSFPFVRAFAFDVVAGGLQMTDDILLVLDVADFQ